MPEISTYAQDNNKSFLDRHNREEGFAIGNSHKLLAILLGESAPSIGRAECGCGPPTPSNGCSSAFSERMLLGADLECVPSSEHAGWVPRGSVLAKGLKAVKPACAAFTFHKLGENLKQ